MKDKLLAHTVFYFVLLIFGSCEKESQEQTTVHGIVTNKLTGEPVKDIPVDIIECSVGWTRKCLTTIQTVYTDASGYYYASFVSNKQMGYAIGVGRNNILSPTIYPSANSISQNKDNTFNFSRFPLKVLQIHYKVLRHDKNWIQLQINDRDTLESFFYSFYNGPNPVNDFDKTYTILVEAGRSYSTSVSLLNVTTPPNYQDYEIVFKFFDVKNVDTTKVEQIVQ